MSRIPGARLDLLLTELAIENLDWPGTEREIDDALGEDVGDCGYSADECRARVERVLQSDRRVAGSDGAPSAPPAQLVFSVEPGEQPGFILPSCGSGKTHSLVRL